MPSDYHGIIVREGIRDQANFGSMKILGQKTGRNWTLLKIGIQPRSLTSVISEIRANLLFEKGVPYYAHLYRDNELIVAFPAKVFRISPDKKSWREAVSYGKSLKIPLNELDFKPCRIEDETF